MSDSSPLRVDLQPRGVLRLTLDRPERHNAFDDVLIRTLTDRLEAAAADSAVRLVILTGAGTSFSAGGDIAWMRRMGERDEAANLEDARALARLMRTLDRLPKPSLALVNGAAIGGGVGLVACCDIAIAADRAVLGLSEARLGLIPAAIAPYVQAAIGPRQARRFFLTAERISAIEGKRIGLVHDVVPAAYLEDAGARVVGHLLEGGPQAQAEAKALIRLLHARPIDEAVIETTAATIARLRASAEGKEGLAAFLDKRKPVWRP